VSYILILVNRLRKQAKNINPTELGLAGSTITIPRAISKVLALNVGLGFSLLRAKFKIPELHTINPTKLSQL
jgi:hypothetical protein